MKTWILTLSLFFILLQGYSQPVVYLDFVTHNEETLNWSATPYYTLNRARLIALADYFNSKGITWNLQSDWVFLTSVLNKETPVLQATTGNKNILRWMHEDRGIEMDPHAHESSYFYPDVVNLMDSVGLPESKLIGGTIYNDSNGINIWTSLVNGQYGRIFPGRFWKPNYMMGGGTPAHVADLSYYGVWNPQSPSSYLVHDTSVHLRHLGVGCPLKLQSTTSVASVFNEIKALVEKVQTGQYPGNGFYLQTIFFEQGDMNDIAFFNKVKALADSADALVGTGKAQWKTLKQAYTDWETRYGANPFQWNCGQVTSLHAANQHEPVAWIYPNPASQFLTIETAHPGACKVQIFNLTGNSVLEADICGSPKQVSIHTLPKGIYRYQVSDGKWIQSGMLIVGN